MHLLITGVAGFIGYHLAARLLDEGHSVVGIDNMNDYYSVSLKEDRVENLSSLPQAKKQFRFIKMDLADAKAVSALFAEEHFSHVVNLAAQAGVRYSLINPQSYISSNLVGFANILEGCRHNPVKHLVFASSSSVYGLNTKQPYSVSDNVDHPVSLYAATKKSNELMAHAYSHLYDTPATGLRFFTVYGPWGRPDMALHLFTTAILKGEPIKVFNKGQMRRDFTYIDDIVEGVVRILGKPPVGIPRQNNGAPLSPSTSFAPWHIYNIGNNQPVSLMEFINTIEEAVGVKSKKEMLPMQPGDVESTWADIDDLTDATGFTPKTSLKEGIGHFVRWYRSYYSL
ncbi:MAG: NAD-dependent epimerase [Desulfovibrio sp.]|nr:NAD-dependent epimerase [Desulfovibrio sp.]